MNKATGSDDAAAALPSALSTLDGWDDDLDFLASLNVTAVDDLGFLDELDATTGDTLLADLVGDMEDCSSGSSSSSSIATTPTSRTAATKTQQPRGKKRPVLKDEIMALRVEAEELERTLKRRQQQRTDTISGNANQTERDEALSLWRQLAHRQRRARVNAEAENADLRAMLQTQVNMVTRMRRLANRTSVMKSLATRMPMPLDRAESGNVASQERFRQMDILYEQSADVFSQSCFTSSRQPLRIVQLIPDTRDGQILEFQAVWFLPFAVDAVADALWTQSLQTGTHATSKALQDICRTQDAIVSFITATNPTAPEDGVSFPAQVASVRYREAEDRIVLVSKIQTRPCEAPMSGNIDGVGWVRVRPAKGRDATEIQWSRRVQIRSGVRRCDQSKRSVDHLSTLVHKIEQNADVNLQMIENMLIDKCRIG